MVNVTVLVLVAVCSACVNWTAPSPRCTPNIATRGALIRVRAKIGVRIRTRVRRRMRVRVRVRVRVRYVQFFERTEVSGNRTQERRILG